MFKTSSANRTIFVVSWNCVAEITLTTLTVKLNIVPGKWHFTTLFGYQASFLPFTKNVAGAYIIVTKYFAITSKLNKVEASAVVALYTIAFSSILSGMKCVQVRPYSYNGVNSNKGQPGVLGKFSLNASGDITIKEI